MPANRTGLPLLDQVSVRLAPTDRQHRRYLILEVVPPAVQRLVEHYPTLECAGCSAPIRHGFERYFLRLAARDPATGKTEPVCWTCGDRLLEWT